jgi:outer membrane receptor protein involved in Fe transport
MGETLWVVGTIVFMPPPLCSPLRRLSPLNMVERVEVLADDVSVVYGSDAVAGVVNFITRKSYEGIEVTGSTGFAGRYEDVNAAFPAGKTWDTGSALFAYVGTYTGGLSNNRGIYSLRAVSKL